MSGDSKVWLDALTDGQLFRDWFSLIAHFFLGMAYWIVLGFGFAFALGTSVILIGIPMLLFMLATTRVMAALDRQIVGALLEIETPAMADDVDTRGANLGERLGMYLGSLTTWRSVAYLLLKLPLGVASISVAFALLPVLAFEMLLLGPLIAPSRPISVQVMHWLAVGSHKIPGLLLPTRKRKRDTSRLETPESAEPRYLLDDDGEIIVRKRVR
jgi:putative sensor protein